MEDFRYFGLYARFNTFSKKEASSLLTLNTMVGDRLIISFDLKEKETRALISNQFDQKIGYLDPSLSRKLAILSARNWAITPLLSFIAFKESSSAGYYWGEIGLLCYDTAFSEPFHSFEKNVASHLIKGIRPNLSLGTQAVQSILDSQGSWMSHSFIPLPKKEPGMIVIKSSRSLREKLIDQARKKKIGCYVIAWLFIFFLALLLFFILHLMGFLPFKALITILTFHVSRET